MPGGNGRRGKKGGALYEISYADAASDRAAAAAGTKRTRERASADAVTEYTAEGSGATASTRGRRYDTLPPAAESVTAASIGESASSSSSSSSASTGSASASSTAVLSVADTNVAEQPPAKRPRTTRQAASGAGTGGSAPPVPVEASALPEGVIDIDALVAGQEAHVTAYAKDIYESYKSIDTYHRISTNYMETVQSDVDPGMRAILVDWLVEVIEEYRLMPETLYIAVQYVDRYLTHVPISRARLQLLGCAAMLLASKYEEIYAPSVNEFCYISNNTYTRQEIIAMERRVAEQLGYRLRCATPKTFMARYLRAARASRGDLVTNLTKFTCELSLQEYRFLKYRPSEVCAAVILTARRTARYNKPDIFPKGEPDWTPTLYHYTGYSEESLKECADDVAYCHRDSSGIALRAIYEKYSHSPYSRVSKAIRPLPSDKARKEPASSCAGHLKGNTYYGLLDQ